MGDGRDQRLKNQKKQKNVLTSDDLLMDRRISIFFSQVQKTMVNSYHQFENVSPDALPYGNSPNRGLHLNCKRKRENGKLIKMRTGVLCRTTTCMSSRQLTQNELN